VPDRGKEFGPRLLGCCPPVDGVAPIPRRVPVGPEAASSGCRNTITSARGRLTSTLYAP